MSQTKIYSALEDKIQQLRKFNIPDNRKKVLQPLIEFIQHQRNSGQAIQLNFICTHNSRRSQLGQVWAKAVSEYYRIPVECFSGGTEETAFFKNAIDALIRAGFTIDSATGENPHFKVYYSKDKAPILCYSKVYNAPENPSDNFAAIMTCSHADENCPFIPGSKSRIALDYMDPKEFDNTPQAQEKYDERSDQIATEMNYVFENIR